METGSYTSPEQWAGKERRVLHPFDYSGIPLKRVGECIFRYGLALLFVWMGSLKFTLYAAQEIEVLVSNSPLFSWLYRQLSLQDLSNMTGVLEISIGIMLATRAFWPSLSMIGSVGAILTFLVTLSFMFTTPGIWQPEYGAPALSVAPGQFLLKDLVLLGVAVWTLGEATRADRAS